METFSSTISILTFQVIFQCHQQRNSVLRKISQVNLSDSKVAYFVLPNVEGNILATNKLMNVTTELHFFFFFYLRLCKTNNIQQKQGHYCSYGKGPASFPARRHFTARKTTCTSDVEPPAVLCQNRTTRQITDRAVSQLASQQGTLRNKILQCGNAEAKSNLMMEQNKQCTSLTL